MNNKKAPLLTFFAFVCLLVPVSMFVLWIVVSTGVTVQSERVASFNSYLPKFMENTFVSTGVSILFGTIALIVAIINLKTTKRMLKAVNLFLVIVGGLVLSLNIVSLM